MIDDTVQHGERHPLTPVLLGLLASARQFRDVASIAGPPQAPPLPLDNPLVLAALGVISAETTLQRWLGHVTRPAADPTPPTAVVSPGPLLR